MLLFCLVLSAWPLCCLWAVVLEVEFCIMGAVARGSVGVVIPIYARWPGCRLGAGVVAARRVTATGCGCAPGTVVRAMLKETFFRGWICFWILSVFVGSVLCRAVVGGCGFAVVVVGVSLGRGSSRLILLTSLHFFWLRCSSSVTFRC